jgi:hypothetical protein
MAKFALKNDLPRQIGEEYFNNNGVGLLIALPVRFRVQQRVFAGNRKLTASIYSRPRTLETGFCYSALKTATYCGAS